MGYLTTFTIYNDGVDSLKNNQAEFCEKLMDACSNVYDNSRPDSFGHGPHANLVILQKPRHADDHTCYVHMGNTVCEMNPYSNRTKYIAENFPDYFESMLSHLQYTVKELKKLSKPKPIHKFNNGIGATICHKCSTIISVGHIQDLYCEKCKLEQ